jgi:hypothetical protein
MLLERDGLYLRDRIDRIVLIDAYLLPFPLDVLVVFKTFTSVADQYQTRRHRSYMTVSLPELTSNYIAPVVKWFMTLPSHVAMLESVAYSVCRCSAETLVRIRPEALGTDSFCVPVVPSAILRITLTRHNLQQRLCSHEYDSGGVAVGNQQLHNFDR